ncbi:MAG: CbiA protein [Actinobacteria bacterium]|nr:CbiA protein [Actinomycetota bacterium]MBM2828816.1 CbiA protein [Actinomycetota bacterium]
MGLKIAVAGKGGSGKTTISVLIAKILSGDGRKVLLVDLDSDPNLANALGVPAAAASPLVHRRDLVTERTGSTGEPGGMFILNPNVADLIESHALKVTDRVSLLPVGTIESAGEGCFCPQTAFVRALVSKVVLGKDESVILDLEAGLEAFGRAAVEGLDLLLIVVEPGMRSVETAKRILRMLPELGIRSAKIVANKVRPGNLGILARQLSENGLSAEIVLAYSDELVARDLEGRSVFDYLDSRFEEEAKAVLGAL